MPTLHKTNLIKILEFIEVDKKNYPYFVETGTYRGETILGLIDEFEKLFTIELSQILFNEFNSKNYNKNKLTSLLDGNTIFFLDGHYSSCDTARGNKDVPLQDELKKINENFKYDGLIIIDDLRLFGTNITEDWSYISKENLLDILSDRVENYFEMGDRLIIKISSK
jgi:hypothetical protein